ncbi:DUF3598 family protein [Calothrix sp. PCC 7507]|uniref:DUF3598 family protein n=1 Tax=Calothrix sp. PCC 7507 TaxID=99598 RepID=UPI00029F23C5|nr:DUF3598 family protein [Calothrix sp. PCC 7507]AFY31672.1 hypothetical protein Cal7507_1200 [Calothrix sp. PCC 7507]
MTLLQAQHWEKLFGDLTLEKKSLYGVWTVYSPAQEIIKSSQGIRTLQANADKTVITHTNQFPSADRTTLEKQWQIAKATCNLPDGLLHPADPSKRAFALFNYGATAWVPQKLELGRGFSVELFLKSPDGNTSIGSIYAENGDLEKILYLRESLSSFPDILPLGTEVTTLPGNWIGSQVSITPDLKITDAEVITEFVLDPTLGKNKSFFLPDSVVVNIPDRVKLGDAFDIVAGKLVAENEYKRLTAKYNHAGDFVLLISEVFNLTDEAKANTN